MNKMGIDDFVSAFRARLRYKLEGKSAWGRQQVLILVEEAMTDALAGVVADDDKDT